MVRTPNDSFVNTALFYISTMSPSATKDLNLESYRSNGYPDEETGQSILDNAFLCLIKDLETIGLIISFDPAEVIDDRQNLFTFLEMISYILPESLYTHLKTNDQLMACCKGILDGSSEGYSSLIGAYLSDLGGLVDHEPVIENLSDCIDQYCGYFNQTDIFTDYFKNIVTMVEGDTLLPEADDIIHIDYRNRIKGLISRFMEVAVQFENDDRYAELMTLWNQMIMDFIAPDNFPIYSYILLTAKDSLPDDLMSSFDDRIYRYKVSSPWCVEYYTARSILPTTAQVLAMQCFAYAWHIDPVAYKQTADSLSIQFPDASITQGINNVLGSS